MPCDVIPAGSKDNDSAATTHPDACPKLPSTKPVFGDAVSFNGHRPASGRASPPPLAGPPRKPALVAAMTQFVNADLDERRPMRTALRRSPLHRRGLSLLDELQA